MNESLLSRELSWLEKYRTKIFENAAAMGVVDTAEKQFPALSPYTQFCSGFTMLDIHVSSMKEAFPVLGFLRRNGFKYSRHEDEAGANCRKYIVKSLLKEDQEILLRVFIKRTGKEKCRFEITGYETIQKPIYKLVCEDGSENASAQSAEALPTETSSSPSSSPEEPSSEPS